MRISINPEVIVDAGTLIELEYVVLSVLDGWHAWAGPDPDSGDFDPYLVEHAAHRELIAKAYLDEIAYGEHTGWNVVIADVDEPVVENNQVMLPVGLARTFLTTPLEIMVENERNDGPFFRRYLAAVDRDLADKFNLPHPPVRFVHTGGKGEAIAQLPSKTTMWEAVGLPPRLFGILDSDSRYPGDPGEHTTHALKVFAQRKVTLHILHKRSIENYLTDSVLQAHESVNPDIADFVAFVTSLSPHQRDHFRMKRGVQPKHAEEKSLYKGVDMNTLRRCQLPHTLGYFLEHPELAPDRRELQSRACLNEFEELAAAIRSHL